jgi:hypothetical protein
MADCSVPGERRPFDAGVNVATRPPRDAPEYCCIQAEELPSVAAAVRPKRYDLLAGIELAPAPPSAVKEGQRA